MSASDDSDDARRHISDGWDDADGRPAAWKAFGEPATTSAPVFGTGAPYLPISSTTGGIQ